MRRDANNRQYIERAACDLKPGDQVLFFRRLGTIKSIEEFGRSLVIKTIDEDGLTRGNKRQQAATSGNKRYKLNPVRLHIPD